MAKMAYVPRADDTPRSGNRPQDPARGQTEETISSFLAGCAGGDNVAILNTSGVRVTIFLTTVTLVEASRRRLYTIDRAEYGNNAWHMRSGSNCLDPKGKSRLIEPTAAVREFALQYPMGSMVNRELLDGAR